MKKEIYDIATAFITDSDVHVRAFGNDGGIGYMFIKYGLADYPYCLTIYAGNNMAQKSRLTPVKRNYGEIDVKRGIASSDGYRKRILLEYCTKREVGNALNKTKSDMSRFLTRIQSPRFFKIVKMAEKRIAGDIRPTDNSAKIFDMIYRIKENQK